MRFLVRIALVAIVLTGCTVATPSVDRQTFLAWHKEMTRVRLPYKGCFTVTWPKKEWVEEPCVTPSNRIYSLGPAGGWRPISRPTTPRPR